VLIVASYTRVKSDTPQATAADDVGGWRTLIEGMRIDHPSARSIALGEQPGGTFNVC
jgi:predicted secreted protein